MKTKTDKGVTLIAENTTIEGRVRYSGELYVNGHVVGDIEAQKGSSATLTVSEKGSVKGAIRVPNVVIGGTVEGDVQADHRVELGKHARLVGDICYKLIAVHCGAVINGKMMPQEDGAANVHALPVGSRHDEGSDVSNQ